ncbi:hypothetical protein D3C78_748360 [compost metagenome]
MDAGVKQIPCQNANRLSPLKNRMVEFGPLLPGPSLEPRPVAVRPYPSEALAEPFNSLRA